MKGFDYRTQQAFDRPIDMLRAELATIIAEGGRRRVEDGETFAHDKHGKILWEAYGRIAERSILFEQREHRHEHGGPADGAIPEHLQDDEFGVHR